MIKECSNTIIPDIYSTHVDRGGGGAVQLDHL
jgi:hypothetical protein